MSWRSSDDSQLQPEAALRRDARPAVAPRAARSHKTRPTRVRKQLESLAWKLGPFIPVLVLWHVVASLKIYPPYMFPAPTVVASTMLALIASGELFVHIIDSVIRLALAIGIAVAVAIPLGIAMGLGRAIARFFEPLVTFGHAIPGLAWIPLAILWFGLGRVAVTFIIFLTVFFPVLVSTYAGVRGIPQVYINAVLTLGATRWDTIREVVVPGALPSIITGVRIGTGFGWRALIAGEMIASTTGLGFMIFDARQFLKSDVVIVGMITIGIIFLSLDTLVFKQLEAKTIERWGTVRQ